MQDRTPLLEAVAACDTLGEKVQRCVALLHQLGGVDLEAVDACTCILIIFCVVSMDEERRLAIRKQEDRSLFLTTQSHAINAHSGQHPPA